MRHFGTGDAVEAETFKAALTQLLNAVIAQKGFLFYWFFCNCFVLLLYLCCAAARNSTLMSSNVQLQSNKALHLEVLFHSSFSCSFSRPRYFVAWNLQNVLGWKGPSSSFSSCPLPWAGTTFPRSSCSKLYKIWPWASPGMENFLDHFSHLRTKYFESTGSHFQLMKTKKKNLGKWNFQKWNTAHCTNFCLLTQPVPQIWCISGKGDFPW